MSPERTAEMGKELFSLDFPLVFAGTADDLANRPFPDWWGRAAQAELLRVIAANSPSLAESLHEDNQLHPYTVSSLFRYLPKESLIPEKIYNLRLTSLDEELSHVLSKIVNEAPDDFQIQLDYLPFRLTTLEPTRKETLSYSDLISYGLTNAQNVSFDLRFVSPLSFKSEDKTQPLPLPGLVFRSLLERWNAFSPIAFPQDLTRYAAECLAISWFKLQSRSIPLKNSGMRIGAVGQIRYRALNHDKYWISMLHSLTRFASFSGAGMGTGYGLGQCRCHQLVQSD